MVLDLAAIPLSPTLVRNTGGTKLTVTGNAAAFDLSKTYRVHIGPNGDATDTACYAGAGKGDIVTPLNATTLECFLPELAVGTILDVFVDEIGTAETGLVADALTIIEAMQSSSFFSMRRLFAPNRKVGNRTFDLFPAPDQPKDLVTQSGDLADAVWTTPQLSVVSDEEDPFGTDIGFILHEDATAASIHGISHAPLTVQSVLGRVYSLTVYAKAINRDFLTIDGGLGGSTFWTQVYDLNTGVVGVVSDVGNVILSSSIRAVPLATNWFRLENVIRADQSGVIDYGFLLRPSNTLNPVFNGLDQDSVRVAFPAVDEYPVPRAYRATGATPIS